MNVGGQPGGAFAHATGRDPAGEDPEPRYRRYQFDLIAPHCGRSLLEVGAGLGEFAGQFTGLDRLVLTDVDPAAVQAMSERFAGRDEVETRQLDLGVSTGPVNAPAPGGNNGPAPADSAQPAAGPEDAAVPAAIEPVESVVAINVLEHIADDVTALRSLAGLVVSGGTLVLWVPAYPALYGEFDARIGHYRRYTPATLRAAAERAGLTVTVNRPVNLLGALAWWVAVRRGNATSPNPTLVRLYDRIVVPTTRFVEDRIRVPFGQSLLCVARVP